MRQAAACLSSIGYVPQMYVIIWLCSAAMRFVPSRIHQSSSLLLCCWCEQGVRCQAAQHLCCQILWGMTYVVIS
jgi:hypothetical protein